MSEERPPYVLRPRRHRDRRSGTLSLRQSEHAEQVALLQWAALNARRYSGLEHLFAIPNGGLRSKATAGRLKAEGVKAGVSDLFLPVPVGRYHGLFIELKTTTGRLTPAQRDFLPAMRRHGYAAVMARGWQAAAELIQTYYRGDLVNDHHPPISSG